MGLHQYWRGVISSPWWIILYCSKTINVRIIIFITSFWMLWIKWWWPWVDLTTPLPPKASKKKWNFFESRTFWENNYKIGTVWPFFRFWVKIYLVPLSTNIYIPHFLCKSPKSPDSSSRASSKFLIFQNIYYTANRFE